MKRLRLPLALVAGSCVLPARAAAAPPASAAPECFERALQRQLDRAASILADWPQLGRYREANAALPPPPAGQARVVFMGDSITDSWDDEGFGGFFPGRPWVNRGISGQTTAQMLVRFRPDVVALRPRAVVILAGTNDLSGNTGPTTLEAIQDNLASMAELAVASGIRVVLASVLPVSDYDRDRQGQLLLRTRCRPPAQIVALNDWMRRYVARQGHVYLDYHRATADAKGFLTDELSDDGLHPNARGYAVMAPLAEKAVAAALARGLRGPGRSRAAPGSRPGSGRAAGSAP
jgi:lysophospholipase L1-like esterase